MSNEIPAASGEYPWRESPPECRLCPSTPEFHELVQDRVGDAIPIVDRPDAGPRETIVVECLESVSGITRARRLYPSHAIVGVLAREDSDRRLEVMAAGADGVVALTDPPDLWRQCLRRVLGGGRWIGDPALELRLESGYARYG